MKITSEIQPPLKATQYKKLSPNALHFTNCNFANNMKKLNKKQKKGRFVDEKLKTKCLMFYFFHVICKISNFDL